MPINTKNLDMAEVMDAAEQDENAGFCTECGAYHEGIEPDARNYECENCGARAVFGAEQIILEGF